MKINKLIFFFSIADLLVMEDFCLQSQNVMNDTAESSGTFFTMNFCM